MRFDRFKILWSFSVLIVFVGTLTFILIGGEAGSAPTDKEQIGSVAPQVEHKSSGESKKSSSGCLLDESAIEDLNIRRSHLDEKERELQAKESELKAAKNALDDELKKITAVREDIEKLQSLQKKDQGEKVGKLVEAFETMSPKASSQLLATIDEVLAVEAMSKISTQKLAKIMNIMEPGSLSRLTERLAGVAQAKKLASMDAREAMMTLKKGGDKNDGQNQSIASNSAEPSSERKPSSEKGEKPN